MIGFEWQKEYETGIPKIDGQHRELFKRIDNLTLALYGNKGKDELRRLITYLKSYIEEHFTYEEGLISRTAYPDLADHQRKHNQLVDYLLKLDSEIMTRGADNYLAIQVEKFIREWWEEHELLYDKKYVSYISDPNNS